ncbi:hypothetical protein OG21DRAFT_1514049 [Imleria badia]|nr:hypothetical protein OG21DRAFT_1514049 [Imleria badia]
MSSSEVTSYSFLYAASLNLASTTFIGGISWGVMTSLYVVCMYSLMRNFHSSGDASRKTVLLTGWITTMWILSSISTIANAYCDIYAFSWEINYPGGPATYLASEWNQPVPSLGGWTYSLTMWFADGLALWRLAIFYHGVHPIARGLVVSFASLLYIGMVGTCCFTLALTSANQTLYSKLAMKAAIPALALSMALSVFVTALISIRLLLFKRWMRKTFGHAEARASRYTSIAAMLIESAALYALWSLVFIIVYVLDNPGQYVMLLTLCNVQVICPVLIVYRVSRRLGWEKTTSTKFMSRISFAEGQVASETREEKPEEKFSDMVFALSTRSTVGLEAV